MHIVKSRLSQTIFGHENSIRCVFLSNSTPKHSELSKNIISLVFESIEHFIFNRIYIFLIIFYNYRQEFIQGGRLLLCIGGRYIRFFLSVCVKYHRNIVLYIHFFGIFLKNIPPEIFLGAARCKEGGCFSDPPGGATNDAAVGVKVLFSRRKSI